MPIPAAVPLRTCSLGAGFGLETGADLGATITIASTVPELVWSATGAPGVTDPYSITIDPGNEATFQLIPTDLSGWSINGAAVDVSGGKQSHVYNITIQWQKLSGAGRKVNVGQPIQLQRIVVPSGTGDGSTLDLDKSASMPGATGGTVTIPDYVAQLEAAVAEPTDTFVAARVNDSTSQTRAGLNALYAPGGAAGNAGLTDLNTAMTSEVNRADAAYAENPDQIWIPATDMWPLVGSEERGYGGTAVPHLSHGWLLADSAPDFNHSEGVSYLMKVPSDWHTITLDVYWVCPGGSATSLHAAWFATVYNIDSGSPFDAGSANMTGAHSAASTSTNRLSITQLPGPVAVNSDLLTRIKVIRNVTSSTNTLPGDVLLVGVLLRKVS